MIITFYHNTIEDIPKIPKNLDRKIKKNYNQKIEIRQFKPIKPYHSILYKMITEIEITENPDLNGKLELIMEDIEKEMVFPNKE